MKKNIVKNFGQYVNENISNVRPWKHAKDQFLEADVIVPEVGLVSIELEFSDDEFEGFIFDTNKYSGDDIYKIEKYLEHNGRMLLDAFIKENEKRGNDLSFIKYRGDF